MADGADAEALLNYHTALRVRCPACMAEASYPCVAPGESKEQPHPIGAPFVHVPRLEDARERGWKSESVGSAIRTYQADGSDEKVDHPSHYGGKENPYEAIKVMEAWHGPEAARWFCILSAEKYLSRMGKKPGEPMLRDLQKSVWYLNYAAKLSEQLESK